MTVKFGMAFEKSLSMFVMIMTGVCVGNRRKLFKVERRENMKLTAVRNMFFEIWRVLLECFLSNSNYSSVDR